MPSPFVLLTFTVSVALYITVTPCFGLGCCWCGRYLSRLQKVYHTCFPAVLVHLVHLLLFAVRDWSR